MRGTLSILRGTAVGLVLTFDAAVALVNDPPVLTVNVPLSVTEGGTGTITSTRLRVSDNDNSASELIYSVVSAPTHGALLVSGAPTVGFTQAQINFGLVSYDHDGSETTSDGFQFTVSDGAGGFIGATMFDIVISAVNDPPVLELNAGLSVNEGAAATITSSELLVTDADNVAADLTYNVVSDPARGTVLLAGLPTASFTQADVDAESVTYDHDGSEAFIDHFEFTFGDGSGGSIGFATFSISISPVNDPPILATNSALAVDQGSAGNITSARLFVSDPDNSSSTLIYNVVSGPAHGTVLLSGSPTTSFSQAAVNAGFVTYQHDGTATPSDGFEFTVSDGAGGFIDATPFSITVTLQVVPVPMMPGAGRILLVFALAAIGLARLWLPRARARRRPV